MSKATLFGESLFDSEFTEKRVIKQLRDGMLVVLADAATKFSEASPVGVYGHLQGAWLNSMNVQVRGGAVEGSLDPTTTAPYAWHVIYGTQPAKNAKNLPPGTLVPWVEKKLGLTGVDAERAAFLIGRKIARRGRKGNRFISPIIKSNYRLWKRVLEEYLVRPS